MAENDKAIAVVGGGIGGLAAAVALTRGGQKIQLLEQSSQFAEVGAGVQLGPNVVRVLEAWGLGAQIKAVAAFPDRLEVRNARHGGLLATLPLGRDVVQRYGAGYATIARADLHALLLTALIRSGSAELLLDAEVTEVTQDANAVLVQVSQSAGTKTRVIKSDILVGADGLWSRVRAAVLRDGSPRVTGHLAYRAMVPQKELPLRLQSQIVTAWMGPDFHVIAYPVRRGEWLNVVAIVHGAVQGDLKSWDHSANASALQIQLKQACTPLMELVRSIADWRLWPLCDRPPMRGASEHAKGRIALLGDAAHPMRPYLAQGAGMAIEDAGELAQSLAMPGVSGPDALLHYANRRWARNARVQTRAIRNGEIFHMQGAMRLGRDLSLRLLGKQLLDVPWLYRGQ
jgi:salicylate hydroxylase